MLDVDGLVAALEPPTFKVGGRVVRGRHISILEWWRYVADVAKLGRNQLNPAEVLTLYAKLFRAFFPVPLRPWWAPWRGPRTVAALAVRLPLAVQSEMIATFLRSQARALGVPTPELGTTTPTT